MGVFDFTKNAGESTGKAEGTSLSSYLTAKLPDMLKKYGLEVDNPSMQFNDGVVTINGVAADQSTREKIILTLGNIKGIGRVEDNMTLRGQEAEEEVTAIESRFYTVKRGDSLSKIAKEFYGDAMKYPEIFEANKPMLKDPNLIYPGQSLRIPDLEG